MDVARHKGNAAVARGDFANTLEDEDEVDNFSIELIALSMHFLDLRLSWWGF